MMDIAWPWQPSATYYASWNSGFYPKPNGLSFYAGFVTLVREGENYKPNDNPEIQQNYRLNSVWSFWGENEQGEPVRFIDVADNLYIRNEFGGEGLSGTVGNVGGWDFIHPNENGKFNVNGQPGENRWYTMLARVWQPEGEAEKMGKHAYMGRWIKDVKEQKWHLIGYAELPIPATAFHGNSGFIEPLTNPQAVRPLMRRFGYARKDGAWISTNKTHSFNSNYAVINILPEDNHEYLAVEYSQRPEQIPLTLTGKPITPQDGTVYTVKQPELPALDKPELQFIRAAGYKNQAVIEWRLAEKSSPQLGYTIEIFDNPNCQGAPIAVQTRALPTATQARIEWDKSKQGAAARFTLRDVFDQNAAPIVIPINAIQKEEILSKTASDSNLKNGLNYQMYVKDSRYPKEYHNNPIQTPGETHIWLTLDEIKDGKELRQGVSHGLDKSVLDERSSGFALKYRGFLNVPAEGLYLFNSSIDGAYELKIDDTPVITRNEQKGTKMNFGFAALSKGRHPFELTWLVDSLPTQNFALNWSGPGFNSRPIDYSDLFYHADESEPALNFAVKALGSGCGKVEVTINTKGHDVKKTVLYLSGLELAAGQQGVVYEGPLPAGVNRFTARAYFDDNKTADSLPVELAIGKVESDPAWTVSNIGPKDAQFGLYETRRSAEDGDAFSFFGNGMHAVTKEMSGDFALSCRVDSWNGGNGEPVNGQSWVGIAAFQNVKNINWNWGATYYLVQRIQDRRTSADYSDLGGSRVSNAALPSQDKPWIRIQRKANLMTSWVSSDGENWELAAAQIKPMPEKMNIGLFFSSPAQHARAHYFANVSHLKAENEAKLAFPEPEMAANTAAVLYSGAVSARSNLNISVVRTTDGKILRTVNGGESFESIFAAPAAVRSIAIHPENPDVMLCGAGNGTAESSGLWKTADGGKTWSKLNFSGDFDGFGPSALCGEVIQFDIKNPEIIYVGCESLGYFRSEDGGQSWKNLGLTGSRITAVTQWRFEPYFPALGGGKTHLLVTVCPDKWMKYLGRGDVKTQTGCQSSKVFHLTADTAPTQPHYETELTGFYNAQWDKQLPTINEFALASSHGYINDSGSPLSFYSIHSKIEWLRPLTALGSAGRGEGRYGRFITQALCPEDSSRVSQSETWGLVWAFQKISGDVPTGGMIAASPDWKDGESWLFVYTDGVYISTDGGKTFKKTL